MDSAIDQLTRLLEEGRKFTFDNFTRHRYVGTDRFGGEDTAEWVAWKSRVINTVRRYCSDISPAVTLTHRAFGIQTEGYEKDAFDSLHETLQKALELSIQVLNEDVYGELRSNKSEQASPALSNRVFVVHGHDTVLTTDVERFLHEVGLEPVVLHRQPDQGMTLIEKFEQHSDVGYALILLTPDEVSYHSSQRNRPDSERETELRARPNVIFEFGYFAGKLGRDRVCCLYKDGVVLPSDLSGLIYKRVDSGIDSIAYSLIKELKAAGYSLKV